MRNNYLIRHLFLHLKPRRDQAGTPGVLNFYFNLTQLPAVVAAKEHAHTFHNTLKLRVIFFHSLSLKRHAV